MDFKQLNEELHVRARSTIDRSDLTVADLIKQFDESSSGRLLSPAEKEAQDMFAKGYKRITALYHAHHARCHTHPEEYEVHHGVYSMYVPLHIWNKYKWSACSAVMMKKRNNLEALEALKER